MLFFFVLSLYVSNILELLILRDDTFSLHNYLLNVLKGSKKINKYGNQTFMIAKGVHFLRDVLRESHTSKQ